MNDTSFRVPYEAFLQSKRFSLIYNLDGIQESGGEVVRSLEGISAEEFEGFLKLLLPPYVPNGPFYA